MAPQLDVLLWKIFRRFLSDVVPWEAEAPVKGVICVSNEAAEVGHDDSGRSLTARWAALRAGLLRLRFTECKSM